MGFFSRRLLSKKIVDFLTDPLTFFTPSYETTYDKEKEKFSEEFGNLYADSNFPSGANKTSSTTGMETGNLIVPSSPLTEQDPIRNSKSPDQLGRQDGPSYQQGPDLETGHALTDGTERKTSSTKSNIDLPASKMKIEEGNPNIELLRTFVVEMRTNHRLRPSTVRPPSVKAFLGLQQLLICRYQMELERHCERVFGQNTLSMDDLDHVHRIMHSYCEAIDDLENMQARNTKPGTDGTITSQSKESLLRTLIEASMEERYIAPSAEHYQTPRELLKMNISKICGISITEFFKMMMAITSGLFIVVPMLIVVLDSHRTRASILVVVSFSIFVLISVLAFIGFVTEVIRVWVPYWPLKAMEIKDMLIIVTGYAAVLMVFVGGYTSGHIEGGMGN